MEIFLVEYSLFFSSSVSLKNFDNNSTASLDGVLTSTKYNDKRKYPDDKLRTLISHFNSPRLRNEDLEKEDILEMHMNIF